MEQAQEPMTFQELLKAVGSSENALRTAVAALGLTNELRRDMRDRRRIVYPVGTLEKVTEWLQTH